MATAEKAIYDRLAAAPTFHPASAALFANDWALDAGDVVAVKSGDDTFSVPIYGMTLDWKGNSMVEIQSTGNEERKPISALKRRQFASGRGGYRQKKEIDGYYQRLIEDHGSMGMIAGALGVVLDADGNPVTDPTTGKLIYDPNSPAEMFSRLLTTPNYAELVSALNNGTQQISGAKINLSSQGSVLIQAINNRPSQQSSVTIDADKINLNGVVTSTEMDTRLMNADALFSNTGYIGTIRASGITAGGNVVAEGAVYGSGIYLGTQAPYTSLGNAVYSFGTPTASGGQISIPWTKVDGTAGTPINFNIAATAYYQQHIGIQSVSAGGWTNDGEGGGYYNTVTATPKAGSASTETVVLPTITVDTTLGTNATTALQAYGPAVSGTKYVVSTATTVYLKADSSYCYITKDNNTPAVGTNVLARISNPGGSPYSAYQIVASWNSYTPGTSSSTRGLRLYAQGKRVSDGAWENLASTTRTIRANHYWNDDEQKYQVTIT